MSATVETKIWLALRECIESIPLDFPVLMPGEPAVAPFDEAGSYFAEGKLKPFIRVGRATADPSRAFIANGMPHVRTGFLILTLAHPMGQNTSVFYQYAGTIAAHFSDSVSMRYDDVCVTITRYPSVDDGYEDNGYFNIPVRIPWRCSA